MKTVIEVRNAFWQSYPEFRSDYRKTYRQSQYNATIRTAFVDYVDSLAKDSVISNKLAQRVTL